MKPRTRCEFVIKADARNHGKDAADRRCGRDAIQGQPYCHTHRAVVRRKGAA